MITTIIFSFDRAIQLELLLASIEKHDTNKLFDLHIIYATSNADFELGYTHLKDKFPGVIWHNEQKFRKKFLLPFFPLYWHNYYWWFKYKNFRRKSSDFRDKLINIVESSKNEFLMFLTDDSIFVGNINVTHDILSPLNEKPNEDCFSLRHGINISGGTYSKHQNLIYWTSNDKHDHPEWSYPFSVDGHIYNLRAINLIIKTVIFNNPNTLEGNVACYVQEHKIFNHLIALEQSCLLGFELNRVQAIVENNNLNIDNKMLNKLYLEGYHLSLNYLLPNPHFFRPVIQSVIAKKEHKSIILYEQ